MSKEDCKYITIADQGPAMGELLCLYLRRDENVVCAGYKVDKKDIILYIRCKNVSVGECLNKAVNTCSEDINMMINTV